MLLKINTVENHGRFTMYQVIQLHVIAILLRWQKEYYHPDGHTILITNNDKWKRKGKVIELKTTAAVAIEHFTIFLYLNRYSLKI